MSFAPDDAKPSDHFAQDTSSLGARSILNGEMVSVGMVMGVCLVAGMRVLMDSVLSLMPVVVAAGFRIVNVLVSMPVLVFVSVGVGVLVRMGLAVVSMLMGVGMLVLVAVDMVVFVRSLHVGLLLCDRTGGSIYIITLISLLTEVNNCH